MSRISINLRHKGRIGLSISVLGLALAAGVANPASAIDLNKPQPISNADANTGGANGQCPTGPYCSTRDGSPSLNGNGGGAAVGKPAAGAVGKADNKNPPGQMPNGSDKNAGYECDRNNGIGRSNPAHTGCVAAVNPPAVNPPKVNPPKVNPPKVNPPAVNPPKVNPPAVNPPAVNPPAVNPPGANPTVGGVSQNAPTVVSGAPQVLGESLVVPAASEATNPLPTFAAAGEADTSAQLVAGGSAALAAFLALGSGALLRRRHGDV